MENESDKIDRLFRERLTDFEQTPGNQVWEKIATGLRKGKSWKAIFFLRIAAGMILFVSLGLGFYLISKQNRQSGPAIASEQPRDRKATDTVTVGTTRKTVTDQPVRKKPEKSDRLQPIRKVYRGPEIIAVQDGEEGTGITFYRQDNDLDRNSRIGAYPDASPLAFIEGSNKGSIPQNLPERLEYERTQSYGSVRNPDNSFMYEEEYIQDDEKPDQSRWILGSEVAPLYSYRVITSDYLNTSALQSMNQSENGLFSFAGGIRVAYSAGRRLTVQSGIYYSRYGQEKNDVDAYTSNFTEDTHGQVTATYLSIRNSTGVIETSSTKESNYNKVVNSQMGTPADFTNNLGYPGIFTSNLTPTDAGDISVTQFFDYLELPVTLKYKIVDRKMDFSLMGGMVTNFLVNNEAILNVDGNSESLGTTSGINKVNYLGSVGLGLEFPVVRNVAISLEPRFRYYLNPIDRSQIIVHPYSFGVFAGFSYVF